MLLAWHAHAWQDYLYWQDTDAKIVNRVNELIRDALRHPFEGIGKPEPLRGPLKGWWSRRITQEHRLVYTVRSEGDGQMLIIAQCRMHY